VKRIIRLRGLNGAIKGRIWEATDLLRVGRMDPLEIVLDDSSVSRNHAEIRLTDRGWRLRDLGSTNGTRLNGVRLGNGQWPLRARDLLQFGEVALVIEDVSQDDEIAAVAAGEELRVAATASSSWDQALEGVAFDSHRQPRPGEQLLALLRAGHHLVHIDKEEELLRSVLHDAVAVLDAQRGAIVLAEGPEGRLQIRAVVDGRGQPRALAAGREGLGRMPFSQSLAARCMQRGESILCHRIDDDPELAVARSIAEGSMASVLCVLLRTPRRRLGILHLDRGPWQKPFTMEQLHLADALAANVSAGIECAQLVRKQRELFLDTITVLAQAVEMRDEYTGGHTRRVSNYALLLAQKLELSEADVQLVRIGTPLHDIGKIGIDDAILRKADRLTPEEFEVMKTHTVKGAEIVATVPDLRPIIPIVRHHHERWDGGGYPDGLRGEAISPLARVVALADAFDAMTSDRPYRKGMPAAVAFAEIDKQSGRQFDPACVAAFLSIREAVLAEMRAQAQAVTPARTRRVRATPLEPAR
jgi:putative nucleotidyltransferase with HDIG domain